jgi:hypothetical protein
MSSHSKHKTFNIKDSSGIFFYFQEHVMVSVTCISSRGSIIGVHDAATGDPIAQIAIPQR